MLPDQIKSFREMVTLKDGVHVLLRPMVKEDRAHLDELYLQAGDDDIRYLRDNVRDAAVLQSWCDNLNYDNVLPVLALVKDRAVGSGTLHFKKGPKRHMGEVRLYLCKEFRKRGLGMKIIRVLVEFARRQGLLLLTAEVTADQTKVVRAFEQMGFVSRCTLEDSFMFPDGECSDAVLMTMRLKPREEEF
ncbi:MAG: GNAT family N-acetyltransferase [Chloroflexota bacterium]